MLYTGNLTNGLDFLGPCGLVSVLVHMHVLVVHEPGSQSGLDSNASFIMAWLVV